MNAQEDIANFVREGLLTQAQVDNYRAVIDLRREQAKKQRQRPRTRGELREEFFNAPLDSFLSAQTVRAIINKHHRYYAWCSAEFLKDKGVPFVKVGKRNMCRKSDLIAWMERQELLEWNKRHHMEAA